MSDATRERTYRLPPRDQAGWILGLGAFQCVALVVVMLVSTVAVNAGAPIPLAAVPLVVGVVVALGRYRGRPLHESITTAARWGAFVARRQHHWTASIPLVSHDAPRSLPAPPFLAGIDIIETTTPWLLELRLGGVGLVADRVQHTLTAAVPVRGTAFGLSDRAEQDRLLAGWGDVLAGFCRERGPVSRVGWTEWAAPVGLGDHVAYASAQAAAAVGSPNRVAYDALLADAGPTTMVHEVLVTVTVDRRSVHTTAGRARNTDDELADILCQELRLLLVRLDAAGLRAEAPLSAGALRRAIRVRLDPSVLSSMNRRARLHGIDTLVGPHNVGPLAIAADFAHVRIDGSWHRTFWVAEWPRQELHPAWMESLLLQSGAIRTLGMVYEPVAPSRSYREINRDATRLASDDDQRARRGFRTGARHHRARAAVLERETELVAGYAELEYAGFVAVTAGTLEELDAACASLEHAAAQSGIELRALTAQHDVGVGACLPLGRFPSPRRFR